MPMPPSSSPPTPPGPEVDERGRPDVEGEAAAAEEAGAAARLAVRLEARRSARPRACSRAAVAMPAIPPPMTATSNMRVSRRGRGWTRLRVQPPTGATN